MVRQHIVYSFVLNNPSCCNHEGWKHDCHLSLWKKRNNWTVNTCLRSLRVGVCSVVSPQFASIMLRQAARGFCRRSFVARGIRTTASARQDEEALPKAFIERFVKLVPSTMAPPSFPTDFMSKEAKQVNEAPSTVPDKLTFNFYLPHEQIAKAKKVVRCCMCL